MCRTVFPFSARGRSAQQLGTRMFQEGSVTTFPLTRIPVVVPGWTALPIGGIVRVKARWARFREQCKAPGNSYSVARLHRRAFRSAPCKAA